MQDLSGKLIKGYHLQKKLGEGGFGAVYLAQQTAVGREVAIKIIRPQHANHPAFIRRFETEAHFIAQLEHMHIVPLYDYWRDPDGAYLVMRLLKGGSLRDAIQRGGPYDIRATAAALNQLATALELAHQRKIIHCDLKPENILLDEDSNAYLADFGIAKDLTVAEAQTGAEEIVGSLDYISPEQARGEAVTPRTDVYSLGVVVYEMLTGTHPWPELSSVERLYKHVNDPLPEIVDLDGADLDALNAVIQKATTKNPAHRYGTPLELATAFTEDVVKMSAITDSLEAQLTRREQEVLKAIIVGKSNREIASDLFVEVTTVKWYVRQIYRKLGVRSRVQAIIRARELNLVVDARPADDQDGALAVSLSSLGEVENPYKGLLAFTASDALDFFGREGLVKKLTDRLSRSRFLAVVGPSGSGKSSVVKAGLVPALWRGDLPGSESWYIVDLLPGARPLDQLEIALTRIAADQGANLRAHLERDVQGLLRCAHLILPTDQSELVVIIDQFEEVFTLVEDETQRQHFLDLLLAATKEPHSRVRIVVTLRADFYDRPLRYPAFGEVLNAYMETILPLSAEGLERAIVEPARRLGVTFEPGLVASIVSETNYQAGALPLLQYALTELFDRRQGRLITQAAYAEIGGVVGALARRAETLYNEMSPDAGAATRQMFLRLVTLGEGVEDTRRRAPRAELLEIADDADMMEEIIDTLAAYRLLSLDHDADSRTPTVEVAHEAVLREWDRLRAWLDESRADIRLEHVLAHNAEAWQSHGSDASFLLRGTRLDEFATWIETTDVSLTPVERSYVEASVREHERECTAEWERQQREVAQERRSRRLLRALVAVLAVMLVGAVMFSLFALDREQAAEVARMTSAFNEVRARELAMVNAARVALAEEEFDTARMFAMHLNAEENASAAAEVVLADAAYAPGTVRLFENEGGVWNLRVHADAGLVLTVPFYSIEKDLWDLNTGTHLMRFGEDDPQPEDAAGAGDIAPDGRTVAFGQVNGVVVLYDASTGAETGRLVTDAANGVLDLRFLPDNRRLIVSYSGFDGNGNCAGDLLLWDWASGEIIHDFEVVSQCIPTVKLTADAQTVIVGGSVRSTVMQDDPGIITLYDLESGEVIRTLGADGEGHVGITVDIAITPDGLRLASVGRDQALILWDMTTGQPVRRHDNVAKNWTVAMLALSPDGRTVSLTSGNTDPKITLFDMNTFERVGAFSGLLTWRSAFLPDSRHLLAGGPFGPIRVIDTQYGAQDNRVTLTIPEAMRESDAYRITASPDLSRLLLSSDTNEMLADAEVVPVHHAVFDTGTGEMLAHYNPPDLDKAHDSAFINADEVLTTLQDGTVVIWNINTGAELRRFSVPMAAWIRGVVDDKVVLIQSQTFGYGEMALLLDITTGETAPFTPPEGYNVSSAQLSPDGTRLVTASEGGMMFVWDVQTGAVLREVNLHEAVIEAALGEIDPQSRSILTYASGELIHWELETGEIIRRYQVQSSQALAGRFTPYGILVAGDDIRLYDPAAGEVRRSLEIPVNFIFSTYFITEHRILLFSFGDGTLDLRLWRFDTHDELIEWANTNRYVRAFTCDEREQYRIEPLCE